MHCRLDVTADPNAGHDQHLSSTRVETKLTNPDEVHWPYCTPAPQMPLLGRRRQLGKAS